MRWLDQVALHGTWLERRLELIPLTHDFDIGAMTGG